MNVVLIRVDSRLVHGQVVEDWVPSVGADLLVVASDEVFQDGLQTLILESCTDGCALVKVVPLDGVAALLKAPPEGRSSALVLVRDVNDAVRLRHAGLNYSSLNLGNIHTHSGSRQVTASVSLNDGDIEELHGLEKLGVEITLRAVSRERALPLSEAVQRIGG